LKSTKSESSDQSWGAGQQGKPGIRRAVLDRFPFVIAFVVGPANAEAPLIVAIAHGKRRPGYWVARKRSRKAKRRSGR
jgi:hypothetical protein